MMSRRRYSSARLRPGGQGGVALAIVLWFIAGMSVLVAGIVAQARVDTHMAQLHLAQAKTVAAGDGAVQLMLADLLIADAAPPGADFFGRYRLGELEVDVRLVPVRGLIDVNSASPDVLVALFLERGLDDAAARQLTENVLQSRTAVGPRAGAAAIKLDAAEDLLRIPGVSRSLLDALRDFIVVGEPAQGGIDWTAAPDEILAVLRQVDAARAESARSRRDGSGAGSRPAGAYRADAVLRYGERSWLRRLWIEMAPAPGSRLPWSVVRAEPPRVVWDENVVKSGSVDAG